MTSGTQQGGPTRPAPGAGTAPTASRGPDMEHLASQQLPSTPPACCQGKEAKRKEPPRALLQSKADMHVWPACTSCLHHQLADGSHHFGLPLGGDEHAAVAQPRVVHHLGGVLAQLELRHD